MPLVRNDDRMCQPTARHTCVLCSFARPCIQALPQPQASVGASNVASYDGVRASCLSPRTHRMMPVRVEPHSAAVAARECYCSATL